MTTMWTKPEVALTVAESPDGRGRSPAPGAAPAPHPDSDRALELAEPGPIAHSIPAGAPFRLLLSVPEASFILGIGRTLMYELLGSGAVESVSVGRLRKVPFDALTDFVARQRAATRPAAEVAQLAPVPGHEVPPVPDSSDRVVGVIHN